MRSRKPKAPEPTAATTVSLPLFEDDAPPSLERAMVIVARVPLDAAFRNELINGHGPYWYATFTRDGRRCRVYIGTDERRQVIANAHTLVRSELERVEAAAQAEIDRVQRLPELAQLRRLKEAAFARPAREESARVVNVPIFDPKKTSPKAEALPRRARQGR